MLVSLSEFSDLVGFEVVEVVEISKMAGDRVVLDNGNWFDVDDAEIYLNEFDDVVIFRNPVSDEYKLLAEDAVLDARFVR